MNDAQKAADRKTAIALVADAVDSLNHARELFRRAGNLANAIVVAQAITDLGTIDRA